MTNVKIIIATHKNIDLPLHKIFIPVQTGASLTEERFNMQHDNDGENISSKNHDYCELTALYWAWKNLSADYYGLCHYRRYLSFSTPKNKYPYVYYKKIDDNFLNYISIDNSKLCVDNYDIVLPMPEKIYMSITDHYIQSILHNKEDLYITKKIIKEYYPEYVEDMNTYLSQDEIFFGNMFIMKKDLFNEYCSWLFDVLSKFDTLHNSGSKRADGYLAERLLGIFFTHIKRTRDIRYKFLQRVDILELSNAPKKNLILYKLLPPGTKRRAAVKRILS